jgi:diguanylate cyclase (GGDEF)-like protein/PAS domain S-box-containing protein
MAKSEGVGELGARSQDLNSQAYLLRSIMDGMVDLVGVTDMDHRFMMFNKPYENEFKRLFGTDIQVGMSIVAALEKHPELLFSMGNARERALKGTPFTMVQQFDLGGGEREFLEVAVSLLKDETGNAVGFVHTLRNVSDRVEAERALMASEDRFRRIFEQTPVGASIVSIDGRFLRANAELCRITGYSEVELQSISYHALTHPDEREECRRYWKRLTDGELDSYRAERRYIHKDGSRVWVRLHAGLARDPDGNPLYIVMQCEDISAQKSSEAALDHLAYYDQLTGLPNRLMFSDELSKTIAAAEAESKLIAIMFVDLDNFKQINDNFGHFAGDQLLISAGERLSNVVRRYDIVSRMGGDEFTIILKDIREPEDAEKVGDKLIEAFSEPFTILGQDMYVGSSIGISYYPSDGIDVETLVKTADRAMYRAKELGKNCHFTYSKSLDRLSENRAMIESKLRRALEEDSFELQYQPRVDVISGRIVGAEALIRLADLDGGPQQFISIAEDTGLIWPISEWVLREACTQASKWHSKAVQDVAVNVNASAQLFGERRFPGIVASVLENTGLDARRLHVELTESTLVSRPPYLLPVLQELREMGVNISVGNFGTGYSSLAHLKNFLIDSIKIGQTVVREMGHREGDTFIKAIIEMAHGVGLLVVAEGVETIEQVKTLKRLGCDELQGYFVSPPMSVESLTELLAFSATAAGKILFTLRQSSDTGTPWISCPPSPGMDIGGIQKST